MGYIYPRLVYPLDDHLANAIFNSFEQHKDIFRLTRDDLSAERMNLLIISQEFHDDNSFDRLIP